MSILDDHGERNKKLLVETTAAMVLIIVASGVPASSDVVVSLSGVTLQYGGGSPARSPPTTRSGS